MSKALEVTYECGYVVTFPLTSRETPHRSVKKSFEMAADVQHDLNCNKCKEQPTEE